MNVAPLAWLLLYVTTISLNTLFITTPQGLITLPWGKVFTWMLFPCNFRQQTAFKDGRTALTELLTVKKKQCKFHGNNSMKEHNYAWCPRLQRRMRNICFVISISAVILKLMVKITSISSSYRFLRIAWHDIFSLSQHLLASWNLYIIPVAESKSKCFLMPGRVKGSLNPIPKLTIVLI